MCKIRISIILFACCLAAWAINAQPIRSGVGREGSTVHPFIENRGQWPSQVSHCASIEGGKMFLENDGFTYHFFDLSSISTSHAARKSDANGKIHGHVYKVKFINSNPEAMPANCGLQPTYYNYFLGDDESKHAGGCRAFSSIERKNIYNGIDLVNYSNNFFMKYDFIVHPSADVSAIKLKIDFADEVKLENGKLVIKTSIGETWEQKPIAYQIINGEKKWVECNYQLNTNEVSFIFPKGFSEQHDLIIDPELVFSTYSGSFSDNFGYSATFDNDGYLYSGSSAFGNLYPTTNGAYQTEHGGGDGLGDGIDMALSKYDISGTFMQWSTFLGGNGDDLPHSLVVNEQDELCVYGCTGSDNFPATNGAIQEFYIGGSTVSPQGTGATFPDGTDIVVAHFNASCTDLIGATYIGGTANDGVNTSATLKFNYADEFRGEISLDDDGNILVVSSTYSVDFPVENAVQSTYSGMQDAVLMKLNPELTDIFWCTYLGGAQDDSGLSITENSLGEIYVSGGTLSSSWPATTGSVQENQAGDADGFVAKYAADGQSLLAATFWGSSEYDQLYFIEIDSDDFVYVYGQTNADNSFFIQDATYGTPDSGMLLTKFESDLSDVVWSTVFGTGDGKPNLSPTAFLVDYCNRVYVSGWGVFQANSTLNPGQHLWPMQNMDISPDAYDNACTTGDFYMAVFDENMTLMEYATFFGGGTSSEHVDGGTSRFDRKGVIYQSVCAGCGSNDDFPIFPSDAVSSTNNSSNCNNGVFKFDFQLPLTVADFLVPPTACVNVPLQFLNTSTWNDTNFWDFDDGTTSTQVSPFHEFEDPGLYDVMLIVTHPGTCNAADTVIKQIEIVLPTVSSLEDAVACAEQPIEIGPDDVDPTYEFTWTPSTFLSDATEPNPIFTPGVDTDYVLLIAHGGCVDTVFQSVNVISLSLEVPNDTTLCDDFSLTLNAEVSPPETEISWSEVSDFSTMLNDGPDDSDIEVSVTQPTTFYVQAMIAGCILTDEVVVNLVSFQTTVQGDFTACEEDTVLLSIENPNPDFAYSWSPDELIISGQNTPQVEVVVNATTEFFVFSETPFDCTATDSVTVSVSILTSFAVNASATPETIVQGQSAQLLAQPDGYSYSWTPPSTLSNSQIQNPIATPLVTTTYYVSVADGECVLTDSVIVKVVDFVCGPPSIYVPNAFTPNADDRNEKMYVRANNITDLYFVIYDRWGEKIFETESLTTGWDATFRGRNVDPDVYVYYLEATCAGGAEYFEKGNITVIR